MSKDKQSSQELNEPAMLTDKDIDLSDIPEIDFSSAERGKFYRPLKQPVTLRLDADVVAWFKQNHPQYQTAINKILREYITSLH